MLDDDSGQARGASDELRELLAFMGLDAVLPD